MSLPTDRIPVPTNGKGPHPADGAPEPAAAPAGEAGVPATLAFTPTQLAVGFSIIASLVLLIVGWMRRRSRSGGFLGRR